MVALRNAVLELDEMFIPLTDSIQPLAQARGVRRSKRSTGSFWPPWRSRLTGKSLPPGNSCLTAAAATS